MAAHKIRIDASPFQPPQNPAASMAKPRKPSATIVDLARHCGVSTSTVSLALRGDSRVIDATRERIVAAAGKLGYRPNAAARSLVMHRYDSRAPSRLIALSLPLSFYRWRYFQDIMLGALEVADRDGYGLLTLTHLTVNSPHHAQRAALPTITQHDVDGLITYGPATAPAVITWLRKDEGFGDRPIVSIEARSGCSAILTDDEQGTYDAVRHLLDLGHRSLLLYIYDDTEPRSRRRRAGAYRALQERGLTPQEHCHTLELTGRWNDPSDFAGGVRRPPPQADDERAQAQLLRMVRDHPAITAIIAINDANALHAHIALEQAGIQVPHDISLIGFDDTDPLLDADGNNLLTTIRVPLTAVGAAAVELLLERVTGTVGQLGTRLVPTQLVVRRTTAPARARTSSPASP